VLPSVCRAVRVCALEGALSCRGYAFAAQAVGGAVGLGVRPCLARSKGERCQCRRCVKIMSRLSSASPTRHPIVIHKGQRRADSLRCHVQWLHLAANGCKPGLKHC
jgi:hypothetical protein